MPADKDGGFVLMHLDILEQKPFQAFESVFQHRNDVSLNKIKSETKKLCQSLELKRFAST